MDDRRRLLARVYSREGAAEEPQEYRDPRTGALVRMTPSEWALAEFDRLHPVEAPTASNVNAADGNRDRSRMRPIPTDDLHHEPPGGDESDPRSGEDEQAAEDEGDDGPTTGSSGGPWSRVRRAAPVLIAAAAFVLGVLVATGISAAIGGGNHAPSTPAAATTTIVPDDGFHPLPGPAIDEFFRSAPRVDDLPAAITSGFVPTSFHEVAGSVTLEQSATIYAAKRLDDQYCLVAVAGGSRVAETCSTVEGIAVHGLTLAKDAVRDVDGRPLTVTVTWTTDGTINWDARPSAN